MKKTHAFITGAATVLAILGSFIYYWATFTAKVEANTQGRLRLENTVNKVQQRVGVVEKDLNAIKVTNASIDEKLKSQENILLDIKKDVKDLIRMRMKEN